MVCKNEVAILEKKELLKAWEEDDPSSILQKARRENKATPLSEYLSDLEAILKSTFKRSCENGLYYAMLSICNCGSWTVPITSHHGLLLEPIATQILLLKTLFVSVERQVKTALRPPPF